jgi:hypothetical protein
LPAGPLFSDAGAGRAAAHEKIPRAGCAGFGFEMSAPRAAPGDLYFPSGM